MPKAKRFVDKYSQWRQENFTEDGTYHIILAAYRGDGALNVPSTEAELPL